MPAKMIAMQENPQERYRLSDSIQVRGRFTRSVHLERDFSDSTSQSAYYTVASTLHALRAVEEALARPSGRALTIIGPYGSGKSAFCVQLARRLSVPAESDGLLSVDVGLLPVLRVGARQPLGAALLGALMETLQAQQGTSANAGDILHDLKEAVPEAFTSEGATPRAIAAVFARAASQLPGGLVLIVDEMGKFLEFSALHPAQSDPFVLQELAEAAARSAPDKPLLVVTVLHQNMEAYARTLTRSQQAEWQKVSERFRQVTFFPSDRERVEMVGQALKRRQSAQSERIASAVKAICSDYAQLQLPPLASESDWETWAQKAYPLHPLTLLALPALFRRVGQSHRSLFTFLSAEEPHALGQFLRDSSFGSGETAGDLPFYGLDRLFDYGSHVLAPSASGGFSRIWAEAQEAVESAQRSLPEMAVRVLKAVALLGVLHDARLPSSGALLQVAFPDIAVPEALARLVESRHIVYRRRLGIYHVWEGGDVDVEAAIQTARTQQSPALASFQVAEDLVKSDVLLARRHSYQTGTLRSVQQTVCSVDDLSKRLAEAENRLQVFLCLAANAAEEGIARETLNSMDAPHILVLLSQETELLRESALDILAAKHVGVQVRELDGDSAARRELAFRLSDAENQFLSEWQRLFLPADPATVDTNEQTVSFYYRGAALDDCDLIPFLSEMADVTYPSAPSLRNEIINRRVLSAAAVAARRNLVEALLDPARVRLEHLGIAGYPPERSIYECLLKNTGLHRVGNGSERDDSNGVFSLAPPDPENEPTRLLPLWNELEQMLLFTPATAPVSVADLMSRFSAPPFGVTEGIFPVLLCVFLRLHDTETTFYREGTFVPEPGISDWEMLMRRPKDFAVNGCRVEGPRQEIVERLAQSLGTAPTVVSVVRALLKMTRTLPDFAKKTRRLSPLVRALRRSLETAQSPETLLFDELPAALGVTGLLTGDFFDTLNRALREWSGVYPTVIAEARDRLLDACGLPPGKAGWGTLQQEARRLEAHLGFAPAPLVPFVRRAALHGDVDTSIDTVLAQVADRPPRTWDDATVTRFETDAGVLGEGFRQLVAQTGSFTDPLLVPQEAARSEAVADGLRSALPADAPPRVLRAALLTLLRELPQDTESHHKDD